MTKLKTLNSGIKKISRETAEVSHNQDESRNGRIDLTTTMRIVVDGK